MLLVFFLQQQGGGRWSLKDHPDFRVVLNFPHRTATLWRCYVQLIRFISYKLKWKCIKMTKFCRVHNCTCKTQVDKSLYFLCSLENCHKSQQEEKKMWRWYLYKYFTNWLCSNCAKNSEMAFRGSFLQSVYDWHDVQLYLRYKVTCLANGHVQLHLSNSRICSSSQIFTLFSLWKPNLMKSQ